MPTQEVGSSRSVVRGSRGAGKCACPGQQFGWEPAEALNAPRATDHETGIRRSVASIPRHHEGGDCRPERRASAGVFFGRRAANAQNEFHADMAKIGLYGWGSISGKVMRKSAEILVAACRWIGRTGLAISRRCRRSPSVSGFLAQATATARTRDPVAASQDSDLPENAALLLPGTVTHGTGYA